MITVTMDLLFELLVLGRLKCDHNKRLLTLTRNYNKQLIILNCLSCDEDPESILIRVHQLLSRRFDIWLTPY